MLSSGSVFAQINSTGTPCRRWSRWAILVYYERFHRDEAHWRKTRLAPLLSFVSQAFVVYLLFTNVMFLGNGYSYANWLSPIDAVVVLAGVGTAFYFKKYRPEKYEQADRLINEGL